MTKTWQLRAFAVYLTLGLPLAASCAKEANTLEGEGAGDTAGSTSTSGKGSTNTAGTLAKAGTTSGAFGGTATTGGKSGSAGDTAMDGGEAASVGGTTAGAAGSATGGSGGSGTTVPPDVLASASAIVDYRTDRATASDKTIQMVLNIRNQSDNPLPMTNVKIRYWFTAEAAPTLHQYYTGEDVRPPSAKFVDDGANSHVLLTFGGGSIKKGDIISRSEVQLVIENNLTPFNQADDFSWQPTSTTSKPNGQITLYLDDKLIWGCEPSGKCFDDDGGSGGAGAGGAGAVGAGGLGAGGLGAGGDGG